MKRPARPRGEEECEFLVARLLADPSALLEAIEGLGAVGSQKFKYSKALIVLRGQEPALL
jgi:hypothetical protein